MSSEKVVKASQEKYYKYFIDTYSYKPVVIDKGEGATIYDTEGNSYIDFAGGIGVASLGYNNPTLVKVLQNQVAKITHVSNIFFSEKVLEVGEKLIKASKYSKVFFSNSGTESNELAMKIARKYSSDKYGKNRGTIVSLNHSFHGRTMMSVMACGQDKYHKYYYPLPEGFKYTKANDIEDFKKVIEDNSICAVILEAIQGEGGVYVLDGDYLKEVEKICNEKDILLICDEVQCGMGRTGKLFAFNHSNIKPDIVTIAKGIGAGLPVGAVLVNEKTKDVMQKGEHGTTFGGNVLGMTAASVLIDELEKPGFYDEVTAKGKYIIGYIKKLNSEKVLDVRGKGLMIGIEIDGDPSEIINKLIENGLLVLSAGKNVIRFLPPLVITYDEIDKGLEILKKVL